MSHNLPDGWTSKRLGQIFEFKNGFNADKSMYGRGKKFINVMEVIYNNCLYEKDIPGQVDISQNDFNSFSVIKGDVLFNRTSEIQEEIGLAAVYLDSEPVTFGGFVIRGRPIDATLDSNFCKYCFSSNYIRKEIIKRGQGAIRSNIGQSDLADIFLHIPSKPEQEKIAKILSTWDEAIEKVDDLISKNEIRKNFLINNLLKGRIRLSKFGPPVLDEGVIPHGWFKTDLASSCEKAEGVRRGPFGGALKKETFKKSGFAVYEQRNAIEDNVSNFRYFIDESKFRELKAFKVQENDFIVSCSGTLGKIAWLKNSPEGVINQALLRLRINDQIVDPVYFLNLFRSPLIQEKLISQGGAIKNMVGVAELKSISFLLPPKEEQEEIAKFFSLLNLEIELLTTERERMSTQKQGLMRKLLTGKKRVKI